jgi:hypothetical protein
MAPSLSTIVEPRMACRSGKTEDPIECSLHVLPKQLQREFQHVFGDKYLDIKERTDNAYGQQRPDTATDGDCSMGISEPSSSSPLELLAIPTNQRARHDLVAIGDEIELEKDRLLNCVCSLISY